MTPFQTAAAEEGRARGQLAGRVIAQHRGLLRVHLEAGDVWAAVGGGLRHRAASVADLPVVGDWVLVDARIHGGRTRIEAVLPRRTRFARKVAGTTTDEQIVVANVDVVWIVSALVGDLNPRRIERYLALVWDSGARPAIVLTKADLCAEPEAAVRVAVGAAAGAAVHVVSARTGAGIDGLRATLVSGTTVALLGSSGVGKSTLINRLAGEEILRTAEVRVSDGRGRHTTSHREILPIPGGALLVDTPGLRELALWDADEGTADAFPEIEAIATGCRFSDCRHESEPGCAVLAAVEEGRLDAARVESHRKLRLELAYLDRKRDARAQAEENRRWRTIHKAARAFYKDRR